jgi:hypothetical protein
MFATVAKLGAGSTLSFENPSAPGVFLPLANALTVGQTGEQGEFVEVTPLSAKVRQYIRGLKTPPTKQLVFNDHDSPNYEVFLSVVDDEDNVDFINFRIDYENGRRASFAMVANGRMMDEADGSTQLKMMVFGQQTGATTWSTF